MTAICETNSVRVSAKEFVPKREIAIIVVIFDLFISFYFWLSLVGLRPFEKLLEKEIDDGCLEAPDFTVVLL